MDPISWNQLPDTAVINVFSYLLHKDRALASSTCKRWRDCYFHPTFWRQVDMRLSVQTGCEPARCILEKCGKFVHELNLKVDLPNHGMACGWLDRGSEGMLHKEGMLPDDLPKYKTLYQELPHVLDGLCGNQGLEKLIFSLFPQDDTCRCTLWPDEDFDFK